ncbi:hypothetical protein BKA00_000976 [Actinomadura coerulea]|uniref:DUF559 domain-containing protein n=1 Tax=Actinomadura coerulea TaxID=46159 RepID=A0A7X0FUR2_9ACTN|nr:hypothetical protein [Actinomadura coerulea]MBB6394062.1 hypothetical protein [Actinomadura coerulea]
MNELDWDVDLISSRAREGPPAPVPVTADNVELPPDHVVKESDVRLTCPVRTALDCARWLPRYEAVAALDQFLRRDVDAGELTAMARTGYREFRVGLEYDGERHHTGREARAHDAHRRDWLAKEMGWEVIPITKNFLTRPAPYLGALLTALHQRGWRPDNATMEHMAARLAHLERRPH